MVRKLLLEVTGSNKIFPIHDPIEIRPCDQISVDSISVRWKYSNVGPGLGVIHTLPGEDPTDGNILEGYVTFSDIVDFLAPYDVALTSTPINGGCKLKSNGTGLLVFSTRLRSLLGLGTDFILAGQEIASIKPVDIHNGLRFIKLKCNAVDQQLCFDERDGKLSRSQTIATIPIPTGPLYYVSQHLNEVMRPIPLRRGTINDIVMTVTDQDDTEIDVGNILISMSIV